jgi:hypothetical protein
MPMVLGREALLAAARFETASGLKRRRVFYYSTEFQLNETSRNAGGVSLQERNTHSTIVKMSTANILQISARLLLMLL